MIRKLLLITLSIYFLFTACTKISTTDIGSGLIPPVDGVITKDTIIDVITSTFLEEDKARVYKGDEHVIGVINNDQLFGKTTASAFFELKPSFFKFSFPGKKADLVADSAVLILSYKGAYGDTQINQNWRVFEIDKTKPLKFDSAYAANADDIGRGSEIGSKSIAITSLDDSVNYGFENAKNQIRIKLSGAFATRLIKDFDSSASGGPSSAYLNDSAFKKELAGFAVVPDPGSGNALIRVSLIDTNTKLALFYKYKNDGATASVAAVSYFRFVTGAGSLTSGSANIIKRDRAGSEIAAHLNRAVNDSLLYLQTSPGTYVKITIPRLPDFPNSIIHRAELITEQVPHNTVLDAVLGPPRYLLLAAYDSIKKVKRNVPNAYEVDPSSGASNIGSFGGFLYFKNIAATRVASYDFNLTRYVQGIVTRKDTSFTFRLSAPSNDSLRYYGASSVFAPYYISPASANQIANGRVRLGGGFGDKNRPYRMRLRIIYSKL